jgi:pimeloyl-ACP methyl ester carboxylesterase
MESASINGTTITYTVRGEGEPLLLIHGAGIDHTEWQPQLDALGKHFKIIAPDVRGHGKSGQTAAPYSIELFADDMVGLLDALGIEKTLVCGHSMGGAVAQCVAAQQPERVKALILAETNYGFEDMRGMILVLEATKPIMKLVGVKRLVDMTIRQMVRGTEAQDLLRAAYAPQVANPSNFWNIWDANNKFKGKAQLRRIQCPTLVMIAENNQVTHKMGHYMAKTIPNARLITIPNAGHGLNWENPEAFNAALIEFFQTVSQESTRANP